MTHRRAGATAILDPIRDNLRRSGYGAFADALNDIIPSLCARWDIREIIAPLTGGLSGATLHVRRGDGTECVLKVAPPTVDLTGEVGYLTRALGRIPVPRLLAERVDLDNALLVEYIPSRNRPFDPACDIECRLRDAWDLIQAIAQLPAVNIPSQSARVQYLDQRIAELHAQGHIPRHLRGLAVYGADLAQSLIADLAPDEQRYCHGDFWRPNLLRTRKGDLMAIDPQPCVGDPAGDLVRIALDEDYGSGPPEDITERLEAATRVSGLPSKRIRGWAAYCACRNVARSYALGEHGRTALSPAWEAAAHTLMSALNDIHDLRSAH